MAYILRILCGALIFTTVHAQDETAIPPADEWYKSEYAPLYGDKPWENADELAGHFTETVQIHNELIESLDSLQWISGALEEWKIAGWVRSEIAEMDFEMFNPTTASFKTRWRDYYNGGNIAYECTWYLADFVDGSWKISAVAGINCNEHGL
ncbi:MAG: hypothetical protein GTN98_09900 [Woeseiaceae bacterium]|nr:hypothetical protein [Woeseiaceae bacterium]